LGVNDMMRQLMFVASMIFFMGGVAVIAQENTRPRAREIGIEVGILPTGPLNAITDVEGVKVGHKTLWRGDTPRWKNSVI